jgi:hypothetical protein
MNTLMHILMLKPRLIDVNFVIESQPTKELDLRLIFDLTCE